MEYLLVDGYNIINAWEDVFDLRRDTLEECREKLLTILSNYQGYRNLNIIVVFDAHMVKDSREKQESFDHLMVVFTKEHQTADNYIERFVYQLASTHTIRVATSDYLEQRIVLNSGGIRMSSRELREQVLGEEHSIKKKEMVKLNKGNSIMSQVDPELLEKLEKMRRGKY